MGLQHAEKGLLQKLSYFWQRNGIFAKKGHRLQNYKFPFNYLLKNETNFYNIYAVEQISKLISINQSTRC